MVSAAADLDQVAHIVIFLSPGRSLAKLVILVLILDRGRSLALSVIYWLLILLLVLFESKHLRGLFVVVNSFLGCLHKGFL
jgi:hypothetical protein